jgi:hypothetical protein
MPGGDGLKLVEARVGAIHEDLGHDAAVAVGVLRLHSDEFPVEEPRASLP